MAGLHIFLWEGDNTDKANSIGKKIGGIAPNRFMNDFMDAVDKESFIQSMRQLLYEGPEHIKLKITVEKVNINPSKKD